jgi:hypothetical protein
VVTDQQARRLWKLMKSKKTLTNAAAKAGMDEMTGRKYRDVGKMASEVKAEHTWRTRPDPFVDVWDEVRAKLYINPGLKKLRSSKRISKGAIPVDLLMGS